MTQATAKQDDVLRVTGATPVKGKTFLAGQFATGPVDPAAYAGFDTAKPVAGDSLAALQSLAQELLTESKAVVDAARVLAEARDRLADVQERRLPDLMERHSLPKFEFVDRTTGCTLIIKLDSDKWRVSMPPMKDEQGNPIPDNEEKRKAVLTWLREIGNGGSIKKNVEMLVGQMADADVAALMVEIKTLHPLIDMGLIERIEPATLTALVNRLLKAGKEVHESIQIKPVRQAKVVTK